jgi:antitoxin MazE
MRGIVKKWGNSAAVRIPGGVLHAAGLHLDEVVDVREQDGQIVITPVRDDKSDLAVLVEAINAENLHGEVDFGVRTGNELL